MVPPKDAFICVLVHPRKYFVCKLLSVGSFGGSIGHLVHRQAILPAFSGRLNLPFVVRTIALAFLRCWALITPTFIIRFQ